MLKKISLISTIFFYLNLSKIFLFKKKREREKNINNLMIRRMWLNFNIEQNKREEKN